MNRTNAAVIMSLFLTNALQTNAIKRRKLVEEKYSPQILINKLVQESLERTHEGDIFQEEEVLANLKNTLRKNDFTVDAYETEFKKKHGFSPWESVDKYIEAVDAEAEEDNGTVKPNVFHREPTYDDVTVTEGDEVTSDGNYFPGKFEVGSSVDATGKKTENLFDANPDWKSTHGYGGGGKKRTKRYRRRLTHRKKKTMKRRKTRRTKNRR